MSELSPAEAVFFAAAALPPADRPAYLARACAGHDELRAQVERMLAAQAEVGEFLEAGPPTAPRAEPTATFGGEAAAVTTDHPSRDEHAGAVVAGRYSLVEPLGEGGMGSVWRAKQTEPVKRFVAMKLIKAGMDSKQVLARFEAERQALALMDHPHIAKVLDGGLHCGRPFFVMELVKGVPITEYCDHHKLTPRQRLELFVPVCQAIQHAHQKGIIHRDIKPSNVLVALYDDRPVVKVIDFGVAKATGGTLTAQTIDTGFGGVVGTPQYMSPEQATFNNLDIDTRSDVYALGVLLYELLTGSAPFTKKDLEQKGVLEMLRVVREEEPPRPSTRLSTADALPTLSANRGTEPKKLTGLLRHELDWIVMKALEKDRTRRYETANGFAADVLRYLGGEAVQAHPPSAAYRLKKFASRNRGQVIAASLVLVALVCGVIGTIVGMIQADAARRRETTQRERTEQKEQEAQDEKAKAVAAAEESQKEREKAESAAKREKAAKVEAETNLSFAWKGNELLGSVFANLSPGMNYASVGELSEALTRNLKKAVAELDGSAVGDPLEVAQMQATLGLSLEFLGDGPSAVVVLEKAWATRSDRLGPTHPDTLSSMFYLGVAYQYADRLEKSTSVLEEALKLSTARLGPDHTTTLGVMNSLALNYKSAGQLDKAVSLLETTLNLTKGRLGDRHRDTLTCMNSLGEAYRAAGKLNQAVALLEEALTIRKAVFGVDNLDTVIGMTLLGLANQDARKPDRALPLLEEAHTLFAVRLGADHPRTLSSLNDLASAYQAAGKPDRAIPLLEQSFKLSTARLGADHAQTLMSMNNLARGYGVLGKHDQALLLQEQVFKLATAKLGPDHPDTLTAMSNLALGYLEAGKKNRALPLLVDVLERRRAKLGDNHPKTLYSMAHLADGYKAVNQQDRAIPLLEEAFKLWKGAYGVDHPDTLICMNNLAAAYRDGGKLDQALPLMEESLRLCKTRFGAEDPKTITSMNNLSLAYLDLGKNEQALPLAEEVFRYRTTNPGADHPEVLTALNNLASAYRAVGRLDKAVPLFEAAFELGKEKRGANHPSTLNAMNNLAVGYRGLGRLDEALRLSEEVLKLCTASLGSDHPLTLHAMSNLATSYQSAGKTGRALPLFEDTLKLRTAKLGPDHPETLRCMASLAQAYWQTKQLEKSVPLFEDGLKRHERVFGRAHPETLLAVCNLGVNYLDAGRLAEAVTFLEEGYKGSKTHTSLRWIGPVLLIAYHKAGKKAEAVGLAEELVTDARKQSHKDRRQLAQSFATCSLLLLEAKAFAAAEPLLRECLAIREAVQPEEWSTFNTRAQLGAALLGQKKYAEAEPLLLKGYEGMKQREKSIPPAGAARLTDALDRLIELSIATNQSDEVKQWQAERAKYPPPLAPMPREKR